MQILEENPVISDRYYIQSEIGQGSFGNVYKAYDIQTGETVAIKVFKHLFEDCIDTKRSLREIYILKRIKHNNIIKIRDFVSSNLGNTDLKSAELYLILEYMPMDLARFLKSNKLITIDNVVKIFLQIAEALDYLKKVKLLHRDLKPSNILIDDNFNVKICDFGLARGLHLKVTNISNKSFPLVSNIRSSLPTKILKNIINIEQNSSIKDISNSKDLKKKGNANKENIKYEEPSKIQKELSHHVGTRWYRAPEIILLDPNYDYQNDIWALGCILAELLSNFFNKINNNFISKTKSRRF